MVVLKTLDTSHSSSNEDKKTLSDSGVEEQPHRDENNINTSSSVKDELPDLGNGSLSDADQEYLEQLMKDKCELRQNNNYAFKHVNKLIDKEIQNVVSLMTNRFNLSNSPVEDGLTEKVTLVESIVVPVDKYPRYNFVGRILGPRGMTAKQLEEETGCKIMVRGRGSSRMGMRRDRGNDNEPLHVVIQCEDYQGRAQQRMKNAVEAINQLLHPPPEGKDELKRKQLIELSIINGTYRPTTATKVALQMPRPNSAVHLSAVDNPQGNDPARLFTSIMDACNSKKSSNFTSNQINAKRGVQDEAQLNSMGQIFNMFNPVPHPSINPAVAAEYYKNLLSYSMADPSLMALMCANQSMDQFNNPMASQQHSSIPQANLQQYLQAAAMLNSVPFLHDGSGDTNKSAKR